MKLGRNWKMGGEVLWRWPMYLSIYRPSLKEGTRSLTQRLTWSFVLKGLQIKFRAPNITCLCKWLNRISREKAIHLCAQHSQHNTWIIQIIKIIRRLQKRWHLPYRPNSHLTNVRAEKRDSVIKFITDKEIIISDPTEKETLVMLPLKRIREAPTIPLKIPDLLTNN